MNQLEQIMYLNNILLNEMPGYKPQAQNFKKEIGEQRQLLRSLMNVRNPKPIREDFLKVQDELLRTESLERGIISIADLSPIKLNKQIYLWKGDITRLQVDGIVNAANSALLGCFIPCHACIDNVIHSAAGLQLRNDCFEIMERQGHEEETGLSKITDAYNLPSKYIIHTVGPIINNELTEKDCELLANSYKSCLKIALENNLKSIAFCCISTGEFHFPNQEAAEIAVRTVSEFLDKTKSEIEVIFNVFKEIDYTIYRNILGEDE